MVYVCKFSEDEIVGVLREHEAGAEVGELCRRHNISVRTFYRWKAELGRIPPSLTARLKELEEENRRLRALLVEAMLKGTASSARAHGAAEEFSARAASQRQNPRAASRAAG
jgi:putative transposase